MKSLSAADLLNPDPAMFRASDPADLHGAEVTPAVVREALDLDPSIGGKSMLLFDMLARCPDIRYATLTDSFVEIRRGGAEKKLRFPRTLKPQQRLLFWLFWPTDQNSVALSLHMRTRAVGVYQCAYRPSVWIVPPGSDFSAGWHTRAMKQKPARGPGKFPFDQHLENRHAIWRPVAPRSRVLVEIKIAHCGPQSLPVAFSDIRLLSLVQPLSPWRPNHSLDD